MNVCSLSTEEQSGACCSLCDGALMLRVQLKVLLSTTTKLYVGYHWWQLQMQIGESFVIVHLIEVDPVLTG